MQNFVYSFLLYVLILIKPQALARRLSTRRLNVDLRVLLGQGLEVKLGSVWTRSRKIKVKFLVTAGQRYSSYHIEVIVCYNL